MPLYRASDGQLVVRSAPISGDVAIAASGSVNRSDYAPWLRKLDTSVGVSANTDWHPANYYSGSYENPDLVSASDISGQIVNAQISPNSVDRSKLSIGSIAGANWSVNASPIVVANNSLTQIEIGRFTPVNAFGVGIVLQVSVFIELTSIYTREVWIGTDCFNATTPFFYFLYDSTQNLEARFLSFTVMFAGQVNVTTDYGIYLKWRHVTGANATMNTRWCFVQEILV